MAFYVNLNNTFPRPASESIEGSVILASAMPMHQLERRRIDDRYPHMERQRLAVGIRQFTHGPRVNSWLAR